MRLALQVIINYGIIGLIIVLFTRNKIDIKMPEIFGALYFDIYMVHNKVMIMGRMCIDDFTLLHFLFFTAVATLMFYFLRTKLCRI